jgi:hypothetical protein
MSTEEKIKKIEKQIEIDEIVYIGDYQKAQERLYGLRADLAALKMQQLRETVEEQGRTIIKLIESIQLLILANSSRRDDEPGYFDEIHDDSGPDRHCWG